jgi:hypothetical protein
MGRKSNSGASAAAQKAAGVPVKASGRQLPPSWLLIVIGAAASALVAYWLQPAKEETVLQAPGDVGPMLQDLMNSAKQHLREGRLATGINHIVQAQKKDVNSAEPAELLDSLREHFSGRDAARHARSAVRSGMERLELVLYDELYDSNELHDADSLFKLARLKMLYHPLDDPKESHTMLTSAQHLLSQQVDDLRQEGKFRAQSQLSECLSVSKGLTDIVKERVQLSSDISRGKTAADVAARVLPSPPFKEVDRRAGLSLKEYRDEYLAKGRPVIITDYADKVLGGPWGWEAMHEACGDMEIVVSERSTEARHLWAGLGHSGANSSLGSWMKAVREGTASPDSYLMDWGLVGRCQAFMDKFVVPQYFAADLWKALPFNSSGAKNFFARHPSVFVGAAGSGGALHVDSYASTFWQLLVEGRKRWTLYALPDQVRRTLLYAGVEHEIMPLTPAAGEKHDSARLPLLDVADVFKVTVEVSAGELMVVPHDVPHMVENIENVLAISMNILDDVAVPRVIEDLHARACFSSDEALQANIGILERFQRSS